MTWVKIEQFQRFCEYLIAMYLTEYFIQEGYYNSCGKCKIEKSLKLKNLSKDNLRNSKAYRNFSCGRL